MLPKPTRLRQTLLLTLFGISSSFAFCLSAHKTDEKGTERLRTQYIARLQEQYVPATEEHTVGSLWSPESSLGDFTSDYKAHHLNDTITIQVGVQTTATQSGTVDSERSFTSSSAITGILGRAPASTNPRHRTPFSKPTSQAR
jgi:flagellar basal body L-ring protein FlgH